MIDCFFMSILRPCVFPFKKRGHCVEVSCLLSCGIKHNTVSHLSGDNLGGCYPALLGANRLCLREESYHTSAFVGKFFLGSSRLSSRVSEKSCDENVLRETIMELENILSGKWTADINVEEEVEQEFNLEPRRLDDPLSESQDDLYLSYCEPLEKKTSLELLRTIVDSPGRYIPGILKKFEAVEDLSHVEASKIIFALWKYHMYYKALQISNWLETTKKFEHSENDYASRLDLIAKVQGVDVAEKYMKNVPDSSRGELLYRTLLANCVRTGNMEESEAVFGKMRTLGLSITIYTLNQMIIQYKKCDIRKIPGILSFMEKENLTPSLLTYRILIATRGETGDMIGMEHLVEDMKKSHGLQPDTHILTDLARCYISKGLKDKAIAILKDIGGGNSQECIRAHNKLLSLYASLDMSNDVSRIWNQCKSDPTMLECGAAVKAWGELGKVEEAEAVFEMAMQKFKGLTSRLFSELLRVYALNNQISKGNEFIKRMRHFRCWSGPLVWDGLVRFYVKAGDIEKASSILSKAAERHRGGAVKPLFNTYMVVMEQYAKCGDVHNTEKWFHRMNQCGYTGRLRPFQILIQAYLKAKTPAYGVIERMKAENVYPNKEFRMELSKIDALKRDVLLKRGVLNVFT